LQYDHLTRVMKPALSFIVFFITFPFIIISAVVKNGIFGFRSLEDWLVGGAFLLISLILIAEMPEARDFFLIVAVLCWAWLVFIWFLYRIWPIDFGYILRIIESQYGGRHKRFWKRFVREQQVPCVVITSRFRYISWTYIFWHVSLASLTFLWGLKLILSLHRHVGTLAPANM